MGEKFWYYVLWVSNTIYAASVPVGISSAYRDYYPTGLAGNDHLWRLIALGSIAVLFIVDDLLGSRLIIGGLRLPDEKAKPWERHWASIFVFLDIAIALLSYCLLLTAFHGWRFFVIVLMAIFVAGAGWAFIAAWKGYSNGNPETRERLLSVMASHVGGAFVIFLYLVATPALGKTFGQFDDVKVCWLMLSLLVFLIGNRFVLPKLVRLTYRPDETSA
jgi:hypothetical protein